MDHQPQHQATAADAWPAAAFDTVCTRNPGARACSEHASSPQADAPVTPDLRRRAAADPLPLPARSAPSSPRLGRLLPVLGGLLLALLLTLPFGAAPAWAAELQVTDVRLEPCPQEDAGSQPELSRPSGASCYALRGRVSNPGRQPVVDTDVFALILDSSGEPVLPNRSRVGSIGDVPPGDSEFALRLAVPAGTPGPFVVRNARARGFRAPVRSRAAEGDELLPLEEAVAPG